VDSLANKVFGYRLSQATGTLTALSPASVNTDTAPVSLAIRGDGLWMFVTNFGSGTVSEYAITPASGSITATSSITTDNQPFGVAVK
jgi:6-phosphogluconolactonase (cycloisomerase 2 family)